MIRLLEREDGALRRIAIQGVARSRRLGCAAQDADKNYRYRRQPRAGKNVPDRDARPAFVKS